jgi:hypothetical protein
VDTEEKINELVSLLAKLAPGFYPVPLFLQFSRLTVNPIVEVVPLRNRSGSMEILLLKRDADDQLFAGQLHTPGTVVRPHDSTGSFEDALNRVLNDELKGVETTRPEFVKNVFHNSGRGMEASQVFWAEVLGEPEVGQFYEVDNLPEQLMQSQLDFIPLAVEHYLSFDSIR